MSASKAARIWRRTWFGALLGGGTAALVAWAHGPDGTNIALGVGAALALLSLIELRAMERGAGSQWTRWGVVFAFPVLLIGCAVVLGWSSSWLPDLALPAGAHGRALELALLCAAGGGLLGLPALMTGARWYGPLVVSLWAVAPLLGLGLVREGYGGPGLVGLLVLSKIGDIAGYYVGNALGRSHPFPNLSPGKTTAGCVGSLVAGVAMGGLAQALGWLGEPRFGLVSGLAFGAALNLAAQAGDLLESLVKRKARVKDSSSFFGPSGGTLDVVDSLLLSVPAALLVWPLLFE